MRYIKVKELNTEVANNFIDDTNPIVLVTISRGQYGLFGNIEIECKDGHIGHDIGGYNVYIKTPGTNKFYRCYTGYSREANKYTNYNYTLKHFLEIFNRGENFSNALVITDIQDFNC